MGLWWSEVQILSPRLTRRGRIVCIQWLPTSFYLPSHFLLQPQRYPKCSNAVATAFCWAFMLSPALETLVVQVGPDIGNDAPKCSHDEKPNDCKKWCYSWERCT